MITVKPWVEIDGTRVPCGFLDIGMTPVVMDGLEIKWGRDGYYEKAEPARATVRLWDSTGAWARRIRDSQALGVHVYVKWAAPSGTVTMFRGVIAHAHARRTRHRDWKNTDVWEVTLTAADPTTALGSVYPLPGVLQPGETMDQRKQWLLGLAEYGGLKIADIDYQSGYAPAQTKPVEVGKDSALEVLGAFYESMSGDAWTYDPEANAVRQCERHDGDFTTYLASFDDARGAVMIAASDTVIDGVSRPGVALSACRLGVPDGIEIEASADTDINRVESTWYDGGDNWSARVAYKDAVALNQPRRMLANDTWMTTDWAIELQLQSAWDRARAEGRRPKHPELHHSPGKTFATERLARWWLRCWEDTRPAFVNGDLAHAWLMQEAADWPPLVSPLGGTVTYRATDGWTIHLHVQWMHDRSQVTPMVWINLRQMKWTTTTATQPWWARLIGMSPPAPITTGQPTPDRDVRWGSPGSATREYRFDESMTWADLKYLDNTTREIKDVLT
ncbi:hypothetical protein [Corynebacterium heidelbergense]|uniref:Minor tail protein n=1 Tax=Corynebacterium heidelbergense TaxID=2055947 RepID=A0A364VA91_9CORY|nr:hypothetical protein [Corynebacterium heidelbergense]RAV33528.1 hypothetical protein CWC39_07940 [Corynebacterium heidelbergense]WCZ36165.1 hypothetical protein CHEID_03025 [Corynebacterium heidelbergense]WCZ37620.1 hypothetical protein CHEID_10515 [Corynebacterium heidelbergense]